MKFTAKRLLVAGAIGISAIVTPLSLTVALSGVGSAPSSLAGATAFDQIMFNQTTSTPADTFVYAPAGAGQTAQTANVSGNCATAAGGAAPILSVCGEVYPSGNYSGTPKAASLGTNGPATGVGAISPAWTIDNKTTGSKTQAEAIDFSPGSNVNVIGSNRVFADAQIPVQRKDTGVAQNASVIVQLAELDSSGAVLGTQNCKITGNTGTQIIADPDNSAVCTPTPAGSAVPSSFQTIEVRDFTTSTSISVVGPTATFELETTVCSGQTVPSIDEGGGAIATLTLPPVSQGTTPVCKSYTAFTSTSAGGQSTVTFNGFSASAVQFYMHIIWPAEPLCSPYVDAVGSPAPGGTTGITDAPGVVGGAATDMCPVHQLSFDGVTYYDQAYCQSAQAPGPAVEPQQELCTVSKAYNNLVLNPDGTVQLDPATGAPTAIMSGNAPGTQIVENWVGDIDLRIH